MSKLNIFLSHRSILLVTSLISPSLQFTRYSDDNDTTVKSCRIVGDSDLYGKGVRISMYIQWAACELAILGGAKEEIKSARRGINILSTVVLINTMVNTMNGSFARLEWSIVVGLFLFFPFFFLMPVAGFGVKLEYLLSDSNSDCDSNPSVTQGKTGLDWDEFNDDPIGVGYMLLLFTFQGLIQPWLRFNIPQQGQKEECVAKGYYSYTAVAFDNQKLDVFLKFAAIFSVAISVVVLVPAIGLIAYGLCNAYKGKRPNATKFNEHSIDWNGGRTKPGRTKYRTLATFLRLVISTISFPVIVSIKKIISINNIDMSNSPITSTSQLLPLLVSAFTAIAICWEVYKKHRKGHAIQAAEEEEITTRPGSKQSIVLETSGSERV